MTAEFITIAILSLMLPMTSITAFVIGYNINATKKVLQPKKRHKPSDEAQLLERIENAQVILNKEE